MTVGALGLLVVHNDPVPEAEIWRAAPESVEVVTGRFALRRGAGEEYRGETAQQFMTPDVATTLRHLAAAGVERVGLCFLSVSAYSGAEFDAEIASLAIEATGVELFTAGAALRESLVLHGARRVLVMAPPWFTAANVDAVVDYVGSTPTRVVGRSRFRLGDSWRGARQDLFDAGAMNAIPVESLCSQLIEAVREHVAAGLERPDVIVVPGSGFRSRRAGQLAEEHLGIPVVSANAAVLDYHERRTAPGLPGPAPGERPGRRGRGVRTDVQRTGVPIGHA